MSKPTIICVDDEPTVLESLKIELKQILGDSCLIETAESAEEALELFEELQTDQNEVALVLADQIMPGVRGDELLKQIHTRSPQTLGIMVTGHADLEVIGDLIRTAKLHCYIAKPWQSSDLRSTVLEAMQSYQQTRHLEAQNAALRQTVQQLQQALAAVDQTEIERKQQAAADQVFLTLATEQSLRVEAAQTQIKALQQLNQRKDNFLEAVSHELRTPISNIRMATQMLEVRLRQLEGSDTAAQCERYFQILRNECQREVDLLNNILALTQLDSDNNPLSLSTVHLNGWLPHVVEPFSERMREHEQQLIIDLPPDLPSLTTDISQLERSLTELLTNAWKYTPRGEQITITAQVMPSPSAEPLSATATAPSRLPIPPLPIQPQFAMWISIHNTGVEIPAEEQERIFEQFYRISNHNFWHQSGTGLGLTIVKKRIEKLHGAITVSSQQGATTFTIKLPLYPLEMSPSLR